MQRIKTYNAILSVLILLCIIIGWFKPFSSEINVMVKYRLLYMLFGLSFILQAQLLDNTQLKYALYAAAACCTIGALVPLESDFTALKTIGLIAGVIITIFNRKRNS
jgi:hypothetical protein